MRKFQGLMMIGCVLSLAGCQTTALNCAGWTHSPPILKPVQMVRDEPAVARWIVAHNKFGQGQGCWK